MAGLLTQPHFARLDALRRLRHVLQGEEGSISLRKRNATTNALEELVLIERGWAYSDRAADGTALPPSVMYELNIAEELITRAQVNQTAAIQHGAQRFQIVQFAPGEPGIFQPAGFNRFWRFWLAPLEEV